MANYKTYYGKRNIQIYCLGIIIVFTYSFTASSQSKSDSNDFIGKALTAAPYLEFEFEQEAVRRLQENPKDISAIYVLGSYQIRKFHTSPENLYSIRKSADFAQQSIDLDSNNELGYCALAEALDAAGQTNKAQYLMDSAFRAKVATGWMSTLTRGKLAAHLGQNEIALGLFEIALGQPKAYRDLIAQNLTDLMMKSKPEIDLISQLLDLNRLWPARSFKVAIAEKLIETKRYIQAEKIYEAIEKTDPFPDLKNELNLQTLRYQHLNKANLANQKLKEMELELSKNYPEAEILLVVREHLALSLFKAAKYQEAENVLISIYIDHEDRTGFLELIQKTYLEAQQKNKLKKFLERLTTINNPPADLFAQLGEINITLKASSRAAFENYSKAIILEPQRPEFHIGQGLAQYKLGKIHEATQAFRVAIELDPFDGSSRYNLACMYSLSGRIDEAFAELETALDLRPDLYSQAQSDIDLTSLRKQDRFQSIGVKNTKTLAH